MEIAGAQEGRPLPRKITVMLLAALTILLVALGSTASGAPTAPASCPAGQGTPRQKLSLNVCGPEIVIPDTNYNYTVVLTNHGKASYGRVKLSVIAADLITRSSIPYRRVYRPIHDRYAAVWTLNNFKPDRTYRVRLTLPFKKHDDKRGSNFVVEVRADGPYALIDFTKDVSFE